MVLIAQSDVNGAKDDAVASAEVGARIEPGIVCVGVTWIFASVVAGPENVESAEDWELVAIEERVSESDAKYPEFQRISACSSGCVKWSSFIVICKLCEGSNDLGNCVESWPINVVRQGGNG